MAVRVEMSRVHLAATEERNGWTAIYAVDDHGFFLHTEPVCTIPTNYHAWFRDWLLSQTSFDQEFPSVRHGEQTDEEE